MENGNEKLNIILHQINHIYILHFPEFSKNSILGGVYKMMIVKKLDPLSSAKIEGIIGVIFGLLAGIIIGIVSSIAGALMTVQTVTLENGTQQNLNSTGLFALGWIAVIVLPIMYGILFFLAGLIGAWLYNGVAKMVGGMKVELEYEKVETTIIKQPNMAQPTQQPQAQQMQKQSRK
jgi:hypothetical protein